MVHHASMPRASHVRLAYGMGHTFVPPPPAVEPQCRQRFGRTRLKKVLRQAEQKYLVIGLSFLLRVSDPYNIVPVARFTNVLCAYLLCVPCIANPRPIHVKPGYSTLAPRDLSTIHRLGPVDLFFAEPLETVATASHIWGDRNPNHGGHPMTSDHAARFIRSHGIDAWSTTDPTTVLAMDVTTERRPGGVIARAEPTILPARLSSIRAWLGY